MANFRIPDFAASLDAGARIAAAPASGTVRGMFFQHILEELGDEVPEGFNATYNAFGSYPVREYMSLQIAAARRQFPNLPVREGLRRLGHKTYPKFAATMVGSAIFAVAGRDYGKIIALASKAYGVSLSPGKVSTVKIGPSHARVQLVDVWPFPDCFQIGVFEGAMQVCHVDGCIQIARHSDASVDYDLQW